MFETSKILARRHALEALYDGTVTITHREEYEKENGATGFKDIVLCENQPCRLSHSSNPSATQNNDIATSSQVIKLFLSPEIAVKAGAVATVTQYGVTVAYKCAGAPAVYDAFQSIELVNADEC